MSKSEHAVITAAQKKMVDTHNELIGDNQTIYTATGSVNVAMIVFGGTLNASLTFSSGEKKTYEGSFGGGGIGGGTSQGTATFSIPPSSLNGKMSFQLTVGANVLVKWYINGVIVGTFIGDSVKGGGEFGGSGEWS
ncbi:MAG: hypothetical protein HEP71_21470 [Roseivirga sp.]|nr:hypothetical protein [Roseivirga sp.]